MSDASKPFAFSQFVPGFDFLRNLTKASGGAGAVPGLPSLSSWVAPTLSVEEVDKRIQELKAVQFWLEQNLHALKATVQALEVQKMTLSTLQGMNLRMEDLANAFTRSAAAPEPAPAPPPAAAPVEPPAPAPKPRPRPAAKAEAPQEDAEAPAAAPREAAAGAIDPLQWWGALTQQFQQIASTALKDASQLQVPNVLQSVAGQALGAATRKTAAKTSARKAPGKTAAKSTAKSARTRTTSRR